MKTETSHRDALPSFQRYQLEFTSFLRDSKNQPKPAGVVKKRMAVYQEIVFNNLFQAVSACFPIAQQVLGKRAWLKLVRAFLAEHSANSPYFREIPEEFLLFLSKYSLSKHSQVNTRNLPPFLWSLCHYEWVELAVSTSISNQSKDGSTNISAMTVDADLLYFQPAFINPLQLLSYDYPVHQISAKYQPKRQTSTQLLVYRNAALEVKFIALNVVTHRLIALLQEGNTSGLQALTTIANELKHSNHEEIIAFGLVILKDLYQQGIICGIYKEQM